MQYFFSFLRAHAETIAATLAFVGLALGFAWVWPPLGLIVPCGIIFTALARKKILEAKNSPEEDD